jgi:HSP20 family protein
MFASIGLGPFALIRRMQEDIDRLLSSPALGQTQRETEAPTTGEIMPALEAVQRGNEFVIRLDLPGVDADTVDVDISEDAVTVRGERRIEREDERDGVYISEVTYGSFERVIPLPPGAVVENATARLVNGVLEVVVPAPGQEVQRGRRLDVQRGAGERTESGQRR